MLARLGQYAVAPSTALAIAGGAALLGGVVATATTHTDGTRNVRRRYGDDYQLRPNSKDAARASIGFERVLGGGAAVLGAGVLGYQLLSGPKVGGALIGGALLGAGVAKLLKLDGAESTLDPSLPEHTPEGQSDMTRHNRYRYQQDGAGYNAFGFYQGARWGASAFSPTYQLNELERRMPTIPNALHGATYFGGNVRPGGALGIGMPTGIADLGALDARR